MAEGAERTKERLENLSNLEPLIGSMRILALRTVQVTLNRLEGLDTYRANFIKSLAAIQASIDSKHGRKKRSSDRDDDHDTFRKNGKTLIIVLGSETGLCGGYNRLVLVQLEQRLAELNARGDQTPEIVIAGEKMLSRLKNVTFTYRSLGSLSKNGAPNYATIYPEIQSWFKRVEDGDLNSVELISYRRSGSSSYSPKLTTYLSRGSKQDAKESMGAKGRKTDNQAVSIDWPYPIIEGDPEALVEEIREHLTVMQFYTYLLEAIAAENQMRFRLLEEARDNTERLIDELRMQVQLERRQEITQQIQELAVSAGLVR